MRKLITFDAHDGQVLDLTFTGDGRALISAGMDNVVKIWSTSDWSLRTTLEGHEKSVNSIALSPDGEILATGSSDATVRLWSLPHGELLHTLRDKKKTVSTVTISDSGLLVATGWYGGRAVIWTTDGGKALSLEASRKNLSTIAISPASDLFVTAGLGDEIKVWEIPSGALLETLLGHETAVNSLHFIDSGERLVSLGHEASIRLWRVETWREERMIELEDDSARRFVLSPQEERAALSFKGRIQVWNTHAWTPIDALAVDTKMVGGMAFSPDGTRFAAGAADGKMRVWDAA